MKPERITRRRAVLVGGQAVAGVALGCLPGRRQTPPHRLRFQRAFRVPPVLNPVRSDDATDFYEITQRIGATAILPGVRTEIWGFEGTSPGPTIHARRGRRVVARHTNRLAVPTAVHLHGGVTPPDSDGFPTDLIPPGTSRTYVYPNDQRAATLWYHDHAMHHTGRNVYMGLAGLYLLHDEEEEALGLPAGPFDVPLIIWERSVDGDGRLHYGTNRNLGAEGDVVLVNGVPWPRMEVCARRYRFRVLNGSNASLLRLALSSGRPFVQIATDGGLLPSPVEHASVPLAMAERAELVVDFSPYPVGTRIVLRNLLADDDAADIMAFDVVCDEPDPTAIPARLSSVDPIRPRALHRRREFTFAGGPASFPPVAHWTVNGLDFDPDRPIATPRLGDVEVWRIVNRKRFGILGMVHPVHLHLVNFQIIGRNGVPPGAHDAGWKDTVAVPPGESATIIARFESYRGRYLVHCHNLEHEDQSMMARYDVV